jgi:hypothetical protein
VRQSEKVVVKVILFELPPARQVGEEDGGMRGRMVRMGDGEGAREGVGWKG